MDQGAGLAGQGCGERLGRVHGDHQQDTVQHVKKRTQGFDDTNDRNASGERVPKAPPKESTGLQLQLGLRVI